MRKYFFILVIFISTGCAFAPIAGPVISGIIAWKNGEASKYYEFSHDIMYSATKQSLENLDIEVKNENLFHKNVYKITAGERDRFKITIHKIKENISKVDIRINFMGDKDYANLIYKKIDEQISVVVFDGNLY